MKEIDELKEKYREKMRETNSVSMRFVLVGKAIDEAYEIGRKNGLIPIESFFLTMV